MGQQANSRRNASLDDKKQRAAGRQKTRGYHELNRDDFDQPTVGRGKTKGAFGKPAGGPPSNLSRGGGGGGAAQQASREQDQQTRNAVDEASERDVDEQADRG